MVLNRINAYVIMENRMQNLELYTQEKVPPTLTIWQNYFLLENYYIFSRIPENWWKLYCLKQRCIKNSVLENLEKLTQCTRSLAM